MRPLRVVLIGPESTGKTRLAGELSARYGVPWAPEHAREYVERHGDALTFADVDPIGRGQRDGEEAAIARAAAEGARFVLLDTDLVSTMVYARHYFGACPAWIEVEAARRRGDLYLLHDVDAVWVPDGLQRAAPERRDELLARFAQALSGLGARVERIEGDWTKRRRRAAAAIDRLLEGA